MTPKDFRAYHSPYANLAAAIIRSGERCNDTRFLNSEWCDALRSICQLDDEMYGSRNIQVRGRARVSAPHVTQEVN